MKEKPMARVIAAPKADMREYLFGKLGEQDWRYA